MMRKLLQYSKLLQFVLTRILIDWAPVEALLQLMSTQFTPGLTAVRLSIEYEAADVRGGSWEPGSWRP